MTARRTDHAGGALDGARAAGCGEVVSGYECRDRARSTTSDRGALEPQPPGSVTTELQRRRTDTNDILTEAQRDVGGFPVSVGDGTPPTTAQLTSGAP